MSIPPLLPSQGSMSWYPHYSALDQSARVAAMRLGGSVSLDEFAGATDDAKLTAALAYIQAQPNDARPALRMPARRINFNQGGRVAFSGLTIIGPDGWWPSRNPQVGHIGAATGNHLIELRVGTGASSWFVGPGAAVYSFNLIGLTIWGANGNSQLLHAPYSAGNNFYSCTFTSLFFYGMRYGIGNYSEGVPMTQAILDGHWGFTGAADTQIHVRGSDNKIFDAGYANIDTSVETGRPMFRFACSKTKYGFVYNTVRGTANGVEFYGNELDQSGNEVFGGAHEGYRANQPATVPPIVVSGGQVDFFGGWYAYAAVGSSSGLIRQTGGDINIFGGTYRKADSAAHTDPFLYQTGGTAQIWGLRNADSSQPVYIRWKDGTTSNTGTRGNRII